MNSLRNTQKTNVQQTIAEVVEHSGVFPNISRPTVEKVDMFMAEGMVVTGFILAHPETKDRCSVNHGRVVWARRKPEQPSEG